MSLVVSGVKTFLQRTCQVAAQGRGAGGTELQEKGKGDWYPRSDRGRGHPGEPWTGVATWGSHLHEMGCVPGISGKS